MFLRYDEAKCCIVVDTSVCFRKTLEHTKRNCMGAIIDVIGFDPVKDIVTNGIGVVLACRFGSFVDLDR